MRPSGLCVVLMPHHTPHTHTQKGGVSGAADNLPPANNQAVEEKKEEEDERREETEKSDEQREKRQKQVKV